jgi:hypothetical protein
MFSGEEEGWPTFKGLHAGLAGTPAPKCKLRSNICDQIQESTLAIVNTYL